ncbi:hypothetical protein HMI54_010864 [Coelomomyces lativittatus]|nr:hypothetical protein HMI54_010864 [Coelomomyces lativittatus]
MANKPSFTMRCKTGPPLFFTKENPPSANTYFPQLDRSNMAASLKGRHKETKIQKTPGPSSYLISTDTLTGPQFSIVGRGEEPEFIDAPGPSSYTPQSNSILSKSPTFILGTRLNPLKVVDSSPGPVYKPIVGTFHQNSGPKVTLKSRHFPQTKIITPGPGDYDISNLDHDILHPIHTKKPSSSKSSSSKLNTPPTPSTPPDSSLKPTSENEKLKCRLPGPADYTIGKASRLVWRTAPGFSLGSRLQVRVNSTGPAPNTYSVKVQSPGKSASMKGKFSENVLVFPSLRQNTLRV